MTDIKSALSGAAVIVSKSVGINPDVSSDVHNPVEGNDLMRSFFHINESNEKTDNKLNEIYDYAKDKAGSDDEIEILRVLKDIKYRMGASDFGVSKLNDVYKYIKLRNMARKYENQAKAMEE